MKSESERGSDAGEQQAGAKQRAAQSAGTRRAQRVAHAEVTEKNECEVGG